MKSKDLENLIRHTEGKSSLELLQLINDEFAESATFSTSFGMEDQVLLHMLSQVKQLKIEIFTLDTGRLFPETINLWSRSRERYGLQIRSYHPAPAALMDYNINYGPNAFYESIHLRKECCNIRKVIPLAEALKDKKVWITGLRADQSDGRKQLGVVEWDGIIKVNPLLDWSWDQLNGYVQEQNVPVNPLHKNGFVSIGCAPCTRAIKEGEHFRSGRWWWEEGSTRECGLHEKSNRDKNAN